MDARALSHLGAGPSGRPLWPPRHPPPTTTAAAVPRGLRRSHAVGGCQHAPVFAGRPPLLPPLQPLPVGSRVAGVRLEVMAALTSAGESALSSRFTQTSCSAPRQHDPSQLHHHYCHRRPDALVTAAASRALAASAGEAPVSPHTAVGGRDGQDCPDPHSAAQHAKGESASLSLDSEVQLGEGVVLLLGSCSLAPPPVGVAGAADAPHLPHATALHADGSQPGMGETKTQAQAQEQAQLPDEVKEGAMALTRLLRRAASWRQLRELLAAHGPSLDAVHLATAARRLRDVAPWSYRTQGGRGGGGTGGGGGGGRIAATRERAAFRTFVAGFTELCGHHLPTMTAAPLTSVLYALAALRCPPPEPWMTAWLQAAAARMGPQADQGTDQVTDQGTDLVEAWGGDSEPWQAGEAEGKGKGKHSEGEGEAEGRCEGIDNSARAGTGLGCFGPQELANSMYALGQLGYDPGDPWLHRFCSEVVRHLPAAAQPSTSVASAMGRSLEPAGLGSAADTSWTAAGVPSPPSASAAGSTGGAPAPLPGFNPQGLSQLAWGMARLGFLPPPAFLDAYLAECARQLPGFTSQGLSNTLWALATLSCRPPDPWVASAAAAALRLMPSGNAFDLSVFLWSLLSLGHTPQPDWLVAFLAATYRQLPSATPEQAARILWGLAKVGLTPPADWIRRWLNSSYVRLLEADPTAITTMAYALASLGIRPAQRWSEMLLVAAWERPLRAFSPPDLTMLLWGLAHCRVVPESAWMDEWWAVTYKRLRSFSPRHLSLLLWSCVRIGQAPGRQWLAGYEAVTLAAMQSEGGVSAEGLSLLAYSHGCLEAAPGREWLAALYANSAAGGFANFNALGLERLLWGIAKMDPPEGCRPDDLLPGWTAAFLKASAAQLTAAGDGGPGGGTLLAPSATKLDAEAADEYDGASYGNLANVLYGLALLRVRPGGAWLVAVMGRVEALIRDFGHTTLVKVAWALPRLVGPPTHPTTGSASGSGSGAVDGVCGGVGIRAPEVEVEEERLMAWLRLLQSRVRRRIGLRQAGARIRGTGVGARGRAARQRGNDQAA